MGGALAPWQRGRDEDPEQDPAARDAELPDAEAPVSAERPPPETARFAPWLRGRSEAEAEPAGLGHEAPLVSSSGAARGEPEALPPEGGDAPGPPVVGHQGKAAAQEEGAASPGSRKDDAIFARIRPLKVAKGESGSKLRVVSGGRHSTRFTIECDEVGLLLKSGPSDPLRWGIFGVLGLGLMLGLVLCGVGLSALWLAPLPTPGTFPSGSIPGSLSYGCTLTLLVGFCMLPCLVALRRGVHLVIDTGPGRARYKGPSGDVEFPVSFVTGMRSESALFCRSVCLHVRGRGLLFLFYSDNLEEISRVRECLGVSIPELRGKRLF